MNIILYTTETCPRCKILKQKLNDKNIPFVEIKDLDTLEKLDITEVPMLQVEGIPAMMPMVAANKWINSQEGNNGEY